MSKTIAPVQPEDLGLEGVRSGVLREAVCQVGPGIEGEALYGRIRHKHNLGYTGDGPAWAFEMNKAIALWNANPPQSGDSIRLAFGV